MNHDMSMNIVSWEQYGDDYIRPNADLETWPPIRSKEQLNMCIHNVLKALVSSKILNITLNWILNLNQEYKFPVKQHCL